MSEKRDLWIPALLLAAGAGVLAANLAGEGARPWHGAGGLLAALVGAIACLPLRLKRGQARVSGFAVGVALVLAALVPGLAPTLPAALGWLLASLAFLAPISRLPVRTRAVLLGAAALFAVLATLGALRLGVPRDLLPLFLGGALFLALEVYASRERPPPPEPKGPLVCVFGGSFDPFHRGHRMLCEAALRLHDRLLVVVAGAAPHKFADEPGQASDKTPFHHRVAMARLGVEGLPRTEVLELEGRRAGPSYTVDTLAVLARSYPPGTRFRLLLGADMFQDFPTWKDADRILTLAALLVARRPGFEAEAPPELAGRDLAVEWLDVPESPVASREIRRRLRAGEDAPAAWLDPAVREYIADHGLYGRQRR